MDTGALEKILNEHFAVLRSLLIDMRQLQRFLIQKDFDACDCLTDTIRDKQQTIEQLECKRLQILQLHALSHAIRAEDMTGEQFITCFPVIDQRKIRTLLSQIREIATHLQLLSRSISQFSTAIGGAMESAFAELVSAKEYTYTASGERSARAPYAMLYDGER